MTLRLHPSAIAGLLRVALLVLCLLAPPRAMAQPIAGAEASPPAPLRWFADGQPLPVARQAVMLLRAAPTHGLPAEDYDAERLEAALERVPSGVRHDDPSLAVVDAALTEAVLRYLHDLHFGRIDPAAVHQQFSQPSRQDFDLRLLLDEALARDRLPELARGLAPALPAYERLRAALADYRRLVADPAWQTPLPPLPGAADGKPGKLDAGADWDGLPLLAARLRALGDLPAEAAAPPRYEATLIAAVMSFQARHGLPADGVIGRATLAQLAVTPAARVRQIELNLERARWTPLTLGPRMILINIPEFVLRAYEVEGADIRIVEQMRVIVGKALDTRTPLFDEDLRYIEFSPYWNVPASIARAELVPKLRLDPAVWTREGYEFVHGDGRVQATLDPAALDAVLAGRARIRQRPGPRNALGDIKFVFPNADNIYLHHTPSTGLFSRERRDLSHGCIRVEAPLALARFVLRDRADWPEARIITAMKSGQSATLKLDAPIPVLIAYGTALVKQGRLHFFDDLYGHDRLLDRALRRRSPTAAIPATPELPPP